MTEEQKDGVLAECLEDYHRARARGEIPDLAKHRERLSDLYPDFVELVAAETAIDAALESTGDVDLPQNWGEYVILGEIGRGGAGVVYEAMHRKLGRKVALKVLFTGVGTDRTARERFSREAQALAQIRHDNIVEIYEYGERDGRPYYAMSLVDGPSLARLTKEKRLPTPREACEGMAGIADALQALHEAGIIHRDVKPSNIMVAPDGRYMLADFGLARTNLAETMTRSGDALGTPLYMSPEQIMGKRKDVAAHSDVYGLGATLYQLLTGHAPFQPEDLPDLMRMVLRQRPQHPRSEKPELPKECCSIAMICLEKEPSDRFATAAAVADDLRLVVDGMKGRHTERNWLQRSLRTVIRHPVMSAAAVLLVGFGVWAFGLRPASVSVNYDGKLPLMAKIEGKDHRLPVRDVSVPSHERIVIQVHGEGFRPRSLTAGPLSPGQTHSETILHMEPADPANEDAMAAAAEELGVPRPPRPNVDSPERSETEFSIQLGYPRGLVRRADLKEWRVYLGGKYDLTDGEMYFEADGKRLYSGPFPEADDFVENGPIPAEVLAGVEPGVEVTWTVEQGGEKHTSQFTLVSDEVDARVQAEFERVAKGVEKYTDARTKRIMLTRLRAEILLNEKLATAAYREILGRIVEEVPLLDEQGRVQVDSKGVVLTEEVLAEDATMGLIELERIALVMLYPSRKIRLYAKPFNDYLTEHVGHPTRWTDEEWTRFEKEERRRSGAAGTQRNMR